MMLRGFFHSLRLLAALVWHTYLGKCQTGPRLHFKRIMVMLAFLPVFALIQMLHWCGFLLDECLFRAYRQPEVRGHLPAPRLRERPDHFGKWC